MARNKEGAVELYLRGQVRALGGDTRKFVSPGRRGVTDQIVLWPGGRVDFVETKYGEGDVAPHQAREHARLRALGHRVEVCWTKLAVDLYIRKVKREYLWFFQNSQSSK